MAGEDAHQTERALLEGWAAAGACFVSRDHAEHPRVAERGPWRDGGRVETGKISEKAITVEGHATPWRCVELALDAPTEAGDTVIRIWSDLPEGVSAGQIARTSKHRWSIEGLFGRLERVLHGDTASLGQPRAACLVFAAVLLAYNLLPLVPRCMERAHAPAPPVSLFYLAVYIRSGFDGLRIAAPPEQHPARSLAAWRVSSSSRCSWPATSIPSAWPRPSEPSSAKCRRSMLTAEQPPPTSPQPAPRQRQRQSWHLERDGS